MRKLILLAAAPLALAACAEETVVEEEEVAAPEVAEMVTANGTAPGTYEVSNAEGPQGRSTLNADGTYQDFDNDGNLVAEGSWEVREGKTCFTPTTEGVDPMCYTESEVGEDGSFTATPDEGEPVTVRPAATEG